MTLRIPSLMPSDDKTLNESERLDGSANPLEDGNTPLSTPFAHDTIGLDPNAGSFRHRHAGAAILLLVIAVAGATLFGMRSLGQAGRIALLDIKIDYPLDAISAAKGIQDQQIVLQDLRTSAQVRQVPLEAVQMNPFEWRGLGPAEASKSAVGVDPAEQARRAAEARKKELQDEFSRLRLHSILGGTIPVARISGEMARVGGKIGANFTVQSIDGRSVVLAADGQQFTMTLGK